MTLVPFQWRALYVAVATAGRRVGGRKRGDANRDEPRNNETQFAKHGNLLPMPPR